MISSSSLIISLSAINNVVNKLNVISCKQKKRNCKYQSGKIKYGYNQDMFYVIVPSGMNERQEESLVDKKKVTKIFFLVNQVK